MWTEDKETFWGREKAEWGLSHWIDFCLSSEGVEVICWGQMPLGMLN